MAVSGSEFSKLDSRELSARILVLSDNTHVFSGEADFCPSSGKRVIEITRVLAGTCGNIRTPCAVVTLGHFTNSTVGESPFWVAGVDCGNLQQKLDITQISLLQSVTETEIRPGYFL
jgi:hypothetical protein